MNADVRQDCETQGRRKMLEQMNTNNRITSVSHLLKEHTSLRKTNIQGEGERSMKAKRERGEEINNLGSTKGQKCQTSNET